MSHDMPATDLRIDSGTQTEVQRPGGRGVATVQGREDASQTRAVVRDGQSVEAPAGLAEGYGMAGKGEDTGHGAGQRAGIATSYGQWSHSEEFRFSSVC